MVRVDDVDYTVKSSDVTLESGYSYNYNLSLNSTFLNVDKVSVAEWNHLTKENLTLEKYIPSVINVYAVTAEGEMIDYNTADESCIGVALHVTGKDFEQKFMIAKNDATDGINNTFYWGKKLYGVDIEDLSNFEKPYSDHKMSNGNLSNGLRSDFTTWVGGSLSDFDGESNTSIIMDAYTKYNQTMESNDMCSMLNAFNTGTSIQNNENFDDWYIPACGQLALMYLAKDDINAALDKIGGTVIKSSRYWSSTEGKQSVFPEAWSIHFNAGGVDSYNYSMKNNQNYVRFIRDIE